LPSPSTKPIARRISAKGWRQARNSNTSWVAADLGHDTNKLFAGIILINFGSSSIQGALDELQCFTHTVLIKPERILQIPTKHQSGSENTFGHASAVLRWLLIGHKEKWLWHPASCKEITIQ